VRVLVARLPRGGDQVRLAGPVALRARPVMDLVRRSGPALVVHLPVRATRLLGARLCDQVGPGLSLGGPVGALTLAAPCRAPDGSAMGIVSRMVRGAVGVLVPVLGGQCLGIDRDMTESRERVEAAIGPKLGNGPRPVVES